MMSSQLAYLKCLLAQLKLSQQCIQALMPPLQVAGVYY